ncbi:MAG: hypothetical protein ROO71_08150 [Balneola sp.]
MRNYLSLLITTFIFSIPLQAQPGTEVYLFDFAITDTGSQISNPVNISDNEGYDNQPSFLIDGSGIFFSSTRNGQTDIALYSLESGELTYLNNTPSLSEYSPVQTPDKLGISFVILSEDGTQQFWKVTPSQAEPTIIESKVVIGYYVWFSNDTYFCFVLADEDTPPTLQKHTISTGKKEILGNNPGRSLHKIPGQNAISFIDKNDSTWKIKAYYPDTGTFKELANTLSEVEDMVWISDSEILMGKENKLYIYDLKETTPNQWELVSDLSEYNLDGITRLAYRDGKLAVVVSGK